jgi:signal transduction histidine kinase
MQMGRLVDELRTVIVLKGALPPLDRHPIDLVALSQRMIDLYQLVTDRHQIALVTAVPTLIGVFDERRIERVLSNLLSNAIKYSPQGGAITITLERVEESASPWAVVEVHDQGVGVAPADLPHMFERFHRGANIRDKIEGHGIGLASARRIAEQHGGMLTATSAEGVGTTLTLRLPLSRLLARGVGADR